MTGAKCFLSNMIMSTTRCQQAHEATVFERQTASEVNSETHLEQSPDEDILQHFDTASNRRELQKRIRSEKPQPNMIKS